MTDEKQDHKEEGTQPATESQLPAINFATFLFSLNSSALVQLGMMEDPMSGQKTKNLPLAKQTIGYEPSVYFEEGLAKAIDWYKANL